MGKRPSETSRWRHKDDSRGNRNYRIVQKGSKDLPQDGPERPANGLCTQDSTEGKPNHWIHARRLHHPHDDALVISVRVGDYNVHRMLVDNGSSADILYYPAFQQMGVDRARLIPTNALLVGFGGIRVLPLGAITLPVTVSDYPQQITKDVTFLVVDCSFAYNGILG